VKVYSIFFDTAGRSLPNKAIEFVLGSDDWLRLMNGTMYFVASDEDANDIFERLRKVIPDEQARGHLSDGSRVRHGGGFESTFPPCCMAQSWRALRLEKP
jgi:hypothetical protein